MLVLVSFARGRQFMDHSDHMCSTVVRPGQTERDSNAVIKSEAELGCCVRFRSLLTLVGEPDPARARGRRLHIQIAPCLSSSSIQYPLYPLPLANRATPQLHDTPAAIARLASRIALRPAPHPHEWAITLATRLAASQAIYASPRALAASRA